MNRPLKTLFAALILASVAQAQTDSRLTLKPWSEGWFGETNDHMLYQAQSDVKNQPGTAQVFFWDSSGRFRFSKDDPTNFALGYRWVTMNFDSDAASVPRHLDEMSLAGGFRLGEFQGGEMSAVLGMGYSSNTPFADTNGIFGTGHIAWHRKLNDKDSLDLTVDYNNNGSFLPDVPLPGFAYAHRDTPFSYGVGYPNSFFEWQILPQLKFDANYAVPYTAYAGLEYEFAKHWSVVGSIANFFNGFQLAEQPATNRLFYQMAQAEAGIRFRAMFREYYLDFDLVAGYAFQQRFSRGFDVRSLNTFEELSDAPYIGLIIVGRL
jgi:hypothetical protein